MSNNDMSTTNDSDKIDHRPRQTADNPDAGPRRDLYDAFDQLPAQPHLSDAVDTALSGADGADVAREWLDGDDAPAPSPDTIRTLLEATPLQLVLHTGQGTGLVRHGGHHLERISLLRNNRQVHDLGSEADDPRFSHSLIAPAALHDWINEYSGDHQPAHQVVALALVHANDTEIWDEAVRADVKTPDVGGD